jgi:uncharacterized membrane protein
MSDSTTNLDIGEILKLGWADFTRSAVPYIVGIILVGLISLVSLGICMPAMLLGYYRMGLKAARGESVVVGDVFSGFSDFLPSLLLAIVMVILITIGFVLLILPGIALCYLLFWAFVLMADGERNIMTCMKRSFEYNSNHVGEMLVVVLVIFLISAAGGAVPFGALVTTPVATAMTAHAYMRAFPRT